MKEPNPELLRKRERLAQNIAVASPEPGIVDPSGRGVRSVASDAASEVSEHDPACSSLNGEACDCVAQIPKGPAAPASESGRQPQSHPSAGTMRVVEIAVLARCADGNWRKAWLSEAYRTADVVLMVLNQQNGGLRLSDRTVKVKKELRITGRFRTWLANKIRP